MLSRQGIIQVGLPAVPAARALAAGPLMSAALRGAQASRQGSATAATPQQYYTAHWTAGTRVEEASSGRGADARPAGRCPAWELKHARLGLFAVARRLACGDRRIRLRIAQVSDLAVGPAHNHRDHPATGPRPRLITITRPPPGR
jgi:hypothetical protein